MARYEAIFEATGDGLILMDTQYPVENGKTLDAEVADFSETDAGERAAACLNALEGIPDPAAFVEAAKAVNKAAFAMRDDWAEASPEKRDYLWRTLHAANITLLCAINEPISGKAVG